MDEKRIVTWEAFKKYHEHLVGSIHGNEGDELVARDSPPEDKTKKETGEKNE